MNDSVIYDESIIAGLPSEFTGAKAYCIKEAISTNTIAAELAKNGAKTGTVVIADAQTGGRGRQGRSFYSPRGGIYMSMIWHESCKRDFPYTVVAAAVVCRVLRSHGADVGIKWVNDIFADGKKVCGILCERIVIPDTQQSAVIIGIGINHSIEHFPDELKEIAGSLNINIVTKQELAKQIIGELFRVLSKKDVYEEKQYYAQNMILYQKTVRFEANGSEMTGKVIGLGSNEELLIEQENGNIIKITSGMVTEIPKSC